MHAIPRQTIALGCLLAGLPAVAEGSQSGGTYASDPARIEALTCRSACVDEDTAKPGSVVRIVGRDMHRVRKATFLGGRGDADDRTVPVIRWAKRIADVRVPDGAPSGRVRVRNGDGAPSPPSVEALSVGGAEAQVPADPVPYPVSGHVFPVRGPHSFGGEIARFGAPRSGHAHQGHDVFAACGTPLVAARGGVVRWKAFQSRAGHYVVVDGEGTGNDYVYMHLQQPAIVDRGERVVTGQRLGDVGDTGAASGCHLHFELWTAPGWQEGGRPLDPLAALRAWDAASGASTV